MRLFGKTARNISQFALFLAWSTAVGMLGGTVGQTLLDQGYVTYRTYVGDAQVAVIRQRSDQVMYVTALVNGVPLRFLVDTGATIVRLTKSDAERIGIDVDSLTEVDQMMTAGGIVEMKPARLETVQIGDVEIKNVRAGISMSHNEDNNNLLGMSFLGRLTRFEYSARQLVLTK
ncbi:MAG: hypothetical protein JWM46_644 [Candidatus Kaiserbacteria bacterium]|nr:hypothetical protein [Candidatus Kaiserbacteria bacterium]